MAGRLLMPVVLTLAACPAPIADELPIATVSTVTLEKRGDGRAEISSRPVGLDCDVDCSRQQFAFTGVDSVDVVIDGFPGAQLIRAFCTATDQETIVADVSTGNDDVRLTVPTIVAGAGIDWRCVTEHRQVHTLDIFFNGAGDGSVAGALSSSIVDESLKRIACGNDCSGAYFVGDIETLTAVADTGSVFVRWGLCDELLDDAESAVAAITVTADINCEAVFDLVP